MHLKEEQGKDNCDLRSRKIKLAYDAKASALTTILLLKSAFSVIDPNKFIKYIMDPFEKYEPWENPEDKLDDFCKAQRIVQEYRKADTNGDTKSKTKRKQLSRLMSTLEDTPSKDLSRQSFHISK